ncbi:MAG: SEL1-like repeat protein [Pseudomonadota bacterium]
MLVLLLTGGVVACWPAGHLEDRKTVTEHMREHEAKMAATPPVVPPEGATATAEPDVEPEETMPTGALPALDLKKITDGCRDGDAQSCLTLGMIKDQGVGVAPDPRSAISLYRRACSGGELLACYSLGVLLETGRGVDMDVVEAAAVYEAACKMDDARSCSNLGYLLELGDGVEEDPDRAAALYRKACKGGAMVGCNNLGVAYEEGLILEPDIVRARDLYRQACDGGHARACTRLAGLHARGCFADGPGGACAAAPDEEAALAALIEAHCEEAGTPIACAAASVWLLTKTPDAPEVVVRLEKACDGGEQWGCATLATVHRAGAGGLTKDADQAEILGEVACEAGFLQACRDLGAAFINGDGVKKDAAKGLAWARKACTPEANTFCPDLLYFCAMGLDEACESILPSS